VLAAEPHEAHVEVAQLEATEATGSSQLVTAWRARAATPGCDAIVLDEPTYDFGPPHVAYKQSWSPDVVPHPYYESSPGHLHGISATCIVFGGSEGR
jgi:hypothetical protein